MKSKEEIIEDSKKYETPPKDYNLLEIHCFLALRQLIIMFYNRQIDNEKAKKVKQHILSDYEKRCKEYKFEREMFEEHIEHLKKTESARIRLYGLLKENEKVTDEKMGEIINTCIEIISIVFKEEFV